CRKDLSIENQLYVAGSLKSTTQPYEMGVYGKVDRIIKNNLAYIGNILALREWYRVVRSRFIRDQFDQSVLDGGMMNLNLILKERIKCLDDLSYKMEYSSQWLKDNDRVIEEQLRFGASWSDIKNKLTQEVPDQNADTLERFAAGFTVDESYIETIQALDPSLRNEGCSWLQSIVDSIEQLWS
ncbi:MAG TPA: hypothetical protein VIR63_03710, partial [Pontiella sp.]